MIKLNIKYHITAFSMLFVTALVASSVFASTIAVTSSNVVASASDDTSSLAAQSFNVITLDTTQGLIAVSGNSSSTSNINFSSDANSVTFSVDVENNIDNSLGLLTTGCCDEAGSGFSALTFTADVDTNYSVSGFFDSLSSIATETILSASLFDITDNIFLLNEYSESRSTVNESFVLDGISEGDYTNQLVGSLTGNLIAGHDYQYSFVTKIKSLNQFAQETESIASGTGNVTLSIGTPTVVPIPAAIWLFGSGLIGLIGVARCK